ncbi:GNAT family N-acetyltransferase [Jatrophihabitans telluris]|uniref:GNAT family N-acetyltransferase n=1 Tax=Jatrophihabitans telluris TaxID=2038343 RepID=A0ABY4QYA3_9ACTN|nr:GNAT family N-acetyltransferase [Jatrophihabitans telluris]
MGEQHLDGVRSLVLDPSTRRFTRIPEPPPDGFERTWLARYQQGRLDGSRECFAILDEASGEFYGLVMAPTLDAEESTAELGYAVLSTARGRGIASAALAELSRWTFARGIHRIELLISAENPASKAVALRCGYRYEGTHRSMHVKGEFREDTERWARLATDT